MTNKMYNNYKASCQSLIIVVLVQFMCRDELHANTSDLNNNNYYYNYNNNYYC